MAKGYFDWQCSIYLCNASLFCFYVKNNCQKGILQYMTKYGQNEVGCGETGCGHEQHVFW